MIGTRRGQRVHRERPRLQRASGRRFELFSLYVTRKLVGLADLDYNCNHEELMIIANVRELKARASEYIREARKSGGVVVVSHGRPTAALIPLDADGLEDYVLEHHPAFRRAIERAFAEAGRKKGVSIERLIEETKREMGR